MGVCTDRVTVEDDDERDTTTVDEADEDWDVEV